jgi:succinate dehydrogenase / fumarate reductase cytochrome b subunit
MSDVKIKRAEEGYFKLITSYRKETGGWAWILHRISGIALTIYLYVHIYALTALTRGREAFDEEMKLFLTPFFKFLEWLLFAFVLYHSLNGIRIVLIDFGRGAFYHRRAFAVLMVIGIIAFIWMGYIIFSAEINQGIANLIK